MRRVAETVCLTDRARTTVGSRLASCRCARHPRVVRRWLCTAGQVPVHPVPDLALEKDVEQRIHYLGLKQPTPLTLQEILQFHSSPSQSKLILSACFLHEEIPIRLARRVKELVALPHGLSESQQIKSVADRYRRTTLRIQSHAKPDSPALELAFTAMVNDILDAHQSVQIEISSAIRDLADRRAREGQPELDLSRWLDKFYLSRISVRMLLRHHAALHTPLPGFIGIIQERIVVAELVSEAAAAAEEITTYYYGDAPEVQIDGHIDTSLTYIPSHFYYILFEMLKNAMRATCEKHLGAPVLPPLQIVVADGDDDVVVKISDQGGGISRSAVENGDMWKYGFSTKSKPHHDGGDRSEDAQAPTLQPTASTNAAIAGWGQGLPISRLYARYFGGDVTLQSMHGYGTDQFIYLKRFDSLDHHAFRQTMRDIL